MKIEYQSNFSRQPEVSFILLDWSCRESFHTLNYLSKQTTPRPQYEVLWVEFYSRRAPQLSKALETALSSGTPPPLDQWIVLEMPETIHYHKHLAYNAGLVAARGKYVVFFDSDTMLRPTFVENILASFQEVKKKPGGPGIALHLDEVRNVSKKYYPFNYPTFEEIMGRDCINWKNGRTTGLLEGEKDPLHKRNYGACMGAERDALVAIGGADEHVDYLGHVCGPYEMTFRLINAGLREVWHAGEFLYHTWHPGTDGKDNYMGPHDGRNVSTTALKARMTRRTLPLLENPAVRSLRLGEETDRSLLMSKIIADGHFKTWEKKNHTALASEKGGSVSAGKAFVLRRFILKVRDFLSRHKSPKKIFLGIFLYSFRTLAELNRIRRYNLAKCEKFLDELIATGTNEFILCGGGEVAEIMSDLCRDNSRVKIKSVLDGNGLDYLRDLPTMSYEDLRKYKGVMVIGSIDRAPELVPKLLEAGMTDERIIVIF